MNHQWRQHGTHVQNWRSQHLPWDLPGLHQPYLVPWPPERTLTTQLSHEFIPPQGSFRHGNEYSDRKMNDRPILTLVLAPRRPVPKPSSTGFPLAFGTGSNGVQNIEAIYDVTHDP